MDLESTSRSLLDRMQASDASAWQRFVDLYGPMVYHWGRRWQLQDADLRDLVQEVFRAVAAGLANFHRERNNGSFRAWLWTITRNKLADGFRRRERETIALGGSASQQLWAELPETLPEDPAATGSNPGPGRPSSGRCSMTAARQTSPRNWA